jgi:L-glyceraldehyde 3-phosphate reductase
MVRQGKALYVGVSSFSGAHFMDAVRVCDRMNLAPITIHQPYYNMLGRGIEKDLLPQTERQGTGVIAFCPLASGMLTDKYLSGEVPSDSRAALKWGENWAKNNLTPERLEKLRSLNAIAKERGQTLAQMALAWTLRLPSVTSALIGASRVSQIEENVKALENHTFSDDELKAINAIVPA